MPSILVTPTSLFTNVLAKQRFHGLELYKCKHETCESVKMGKLKFKKHKKENMQNEFTLKGIQELGGDKVLFEINVAKINVFRLCIRLICFSLIIAHSKILVSYS